METHREKRRHPRVDAQIAIKYRRTLGTPKGYKGVQTRDIGLGGIRFHAEDFIPHGTSILIEVFVPEHPRPVRAISKVAWSRKLHSAFRYEIGSQFMEIIPLERQILEGFLCCTAGEELPA